MNAQAVKEQIQEALKGFSSKNFRDNARHFFAILGYKSEKRIDLTPNTADGFVSQFDQQGKLNAERAFLNHWRSVDLLFQLTSEEISLSGQEQLAFRHLPKIS